MGIGFGRTAKCGVEDNLLVSEISVRVAARAGWENSGWGAPP